MRIRPTGTSIGSQYIVDGRIMEVIHVDTEVVTFRDLERTRTRSLTVDRMMSEISNHTIVQYALPPGAGSKAIAFLNPLDPAVISAKRKVHYVEEALKQLRGSLPVNETNALITRLSREINDPKPPCYSSVYKWSKQYKKHNCDRFSLLKDRSLMPRGKRLNPDAENVMQDMISQYYLTSPCIRPKTLHSYIHAQIILINRRREGYSTMLLTAPSPSTVQRRLRKTCQLTNDKLRHGQDYIKKKSSSSTLTTEPTRLLDVAEMDSHLCKINVIDRDGKFLGEIAWITVIKELHTRCVIGWELSPTYPCAEKTIRALKKALVAVPGEENRRGKPIYLQSDNGSEFKNATVRYFLDRLNILYGRIPPVTPNAQAHIERFFGSFELWLHEQAGATNSDRSKRVFYDAEQEAAFTIEEMRKYFEGWIENVYHQRKHRTLNIPPTIAWDRAMTNRLPPEKFTETALNMLCRYVKHAHISAAGRVQFFSLSWYGPGLPEIRAKLRKGQRAICYCNPLDLGEIWVAHPDDPRSPLRAYATFPRYQNGLTLTEHELLHCQRLEEGRMFDDSEADLALLHMRQQMAEDYKSSRLKRREGRSGKEIIANGAGSGDEKHSREPNQPRFSDIPDYEVDRI